MRITKRLLPFAASLLLAASATVAQPPQPTSAQSDTISVTTDSLQIISNDTTVIINPEAETSDNDIDGLFIGDDNRLKLRLDNGDEADIIDLLDDGLDLASKPAWVIVAILFIVFCVPCVAVLIALGLMFNFLRRRNRERNELISKAIDNNYTLPDAFYGRQSSSYSQTSCQPCSATEGEENANRPTPPPAPVRNPKTFSNALTLIVVGLCVFLFFTIVANAGVGFLLGGIPLFLGIGRMIGYYYIPGFDSPNQKRNYCEPRPPYQGNYYDNNNGFNGYNRQPPYYNGNFSQNSTPNRPGNTPPGNCPPPPADYNR